MQTNKKSALQQAAPNLRANDTAAIDKAVTASWAKIAPFWPLKNLIAVNPLAGFEDLSFEAGLRQAAVYFQQKDLPDTMQLINIETIKWLQAFFDNAQAIIQMPNKNLGLFKSITLLVSFDKKLHNNDPHKKQWLSSLPNEPAKVIAVALEYLNIDAQEQQLFLTLMLTTLPGWAAYIRYLNNWADPENNSDLYNSVQLEYLAIRLVFTCLIWENAHELLVWHHKASQKANTDAIYKQICAAERNFQQEICTKLALASKPEPNIKLKAQLVFCIDVRSEPLRRALEAQGSYETYGIAGFFGIPIRVVNAVTGDSHASCPVLLKPNHKIIEMPNCELQACQDSHNRLQIIKKIYQSLKYTFTTPFNLVEIMGIVNGIWMAIRSFAPRSAVALQTALKLTLSHNYVLTSNTTDMSLEQQVEYAYGALKIIGLTANFAPLVVLCGHGSTTQNNAYATALDCGACGGYHGAPNARILVAILNAKNVVKALQTRGIAIPKDTLFLAAEHNTTTDEVTLYHNIPSETHAKQISSLKHDLQYARNMNCIYRAKQLGSAIDIKQANKLIALRAADWAEVRPEWGLAKNAAFIIAPRWLSKVISLEGRAFLHSYEWQQDLDRSSLTNIMTAPMIVAQWINAQYFFATLDNIAFGGGSKVTKNIIGKLGIMQGNASDLMHGLPMQSVFKSDAEPYHEIVRLTVVIYAPKIYINSVITQHAILQKLFNNGWLHLICIDPQEQQQFLLQKDLSWQKHY